mmetsp:Transcript_6890/g.9508  ORF Transcript_6890/g.9508 Transcript_6890/m.9508 type:complete len:414 (+) Transcript_6890:111-1352(+)
MEKDPWSGGMLWGINVKKLITGKSSKVAKKSWRVCVEYDAELHPRCERFNKLITSTRKYSLVLQEILNLAWWTLDEPKRWWKHMQQNLNEEDEIKIITSGPPIWGDRKSKAQIELVNMTGSDLKIYSYLRRMRQKDTTSWCYGRALQKNEGVLPLHHRASFDPRKHTEKLKHLQDLLEIHYGDDGYDVLVVCFNGGCFDITIGIMFDQEGNLRYRKVENFVTECTHTNLDIALSLSKAEIVQCPNKSKFLINLKRPELKLENQDSYKQRMDLDQKEFLDAPKSDVKYSFRKETLKKGVTCKKGAPWKNCVLYIDDFDLFVTSEKDKYITQLPLGNYECSYEKNSKEFFLKEKHNDPKERKQIIPKPSKSMNKWVNKRMVYMFKTNLEYEAKEWYDCIRDVMKNRKNLCETKLT